MLGPFVFRFFGRGPAPAARGPPGDLPVRPMVNPSLQCCFRRLKLKRKVFVDYPFFTDKNYTETKWKEAMMTKTKIKFTDNFVNK